MWNVIPSSKDFPCFAWETETSTLPFLSSLFLGSHFIERMRVLLLQVFSPALKMGKKDLKVLTLNEVVLVPKHEEAFHDHKAESSIAFGQWKKIFEEQRVVIK